MKTAANIMAAAALALAYMAGAVGAGYWSAACCFVSGALAYAALLAVGADAYAEGQRDCDCNFEEYK